MPNKLQINLGQGGLGRPAAGEDYISGYIHYTTALPSGFSVNDRIKQVFSIDDAETLGITDTHIGETKAIGQFTVTVAGGSADTLSLNVLTINGTTNLGSYNGSAGVTATTAVATAIATVINSGSLTHGYTATASTSSVNVTAPAGAGIGANTYLFSNTATGTITTTGTTFNGGVASQIDIIHYHIDEYFRGNPTGNLFVGVYTASTDFNEVVLVQNAAEGKIRQLGVYTQAAFSTADIAKLQLKANMCDQNYKPLEVFYQPDFSTSADLTLLSDLHNQSSQNVSVCIGQDGNAKGNTLWQATGKSIGCVGIYLGANSSANVAWSVAWVGKYNMSAVELETPAFANGTKLTSLSDGLIDNIDDKGYVFLKKHVGIAGSYFDNPYTCVPVTSDYYLVQYNRTVNKAKRNLRTFLLPELASPILVNADGTLTEDKISYFKTVCARALDAMESNGEISAYKVTINPAQNIISTSQLFIGVQIVPLGTANKITVNLSYAVSLA